MADPTVATLPGGREGFNCRLTVGGYGVRLCRVVEVGFTLNIISSPEGEAATRKAFYPLVTSGSSFNMAVLHASYAERESFNAWLRGYMEGVVANRRITGTMKIEVPVRRFLRVGVCEGSLTYGDAYDALTYATTLSFVGASDPLNAVGGASVEGVSYYRPSVKGEKRVVPYFYPSGTQLSGAESLEGTIFDDTVSAAEVSAPDLMKSYRELRDAGIINISPGNFLALSGG